MGPLDVVTPRIESEGPLDLVPGPSHRGLGAGQSVSVGSAEAKLTVPVRIVSQAEGAPIEAATVYLSTHGTGISGEFTAIALGRTDPTGRLRVTVPRSVAPLTLIVNHPRFSPAEVPVSDDGSEVLVRLPSGRAIAGTVLDPAGRPASNVTLVARRVRETAVARGELVQYPGRDTARLQTDARGEFRFECLGEGTYRIDIEHDDLRVDPPASTTTVPGAKSAFPDAVVAQAGDEKIVLRTCYLAFYRVRVVDATDGFAIVQPMLITVTHPGRSAGVSSDNSRHHRLANHDLDDESLGDWKTGVYGGSVLIRAGDVPDAVDLTVDALGYRETVSRCPLLRTRQLREDHQISVVPITRSLDSAPMGRVIVHPNGFDSVRALDSRLVLGGTLVGHGSDRASVYVVSFDPGAPVGEGFRWPAGEWEFVVNGVAATGGPVTAVVASGQSTTLAIPMHAEGCLFHIKARDGSDLTEVRVSRQPLVRDPMGVLKLPSKEDRWIVARASPVRTDNDVPGIFVRMPVGFHRVSVAHPGFMPRELDVEVSVDSTPLIEVVLQEVER